MRDHQYPFNVAQFSSFVITNKESPKEWLKHYSPYFHYKITQLKPFSHFLNFQRFKLPGSFEDIKIKLSNNFQYFHVNYIFISILVTIVLLLFQNWFLFLILLVSSVGFIALQNIKIQVFEVQFAGKDYRLDKKYIYLVLFIILVPTVFLVYPLHLFYEVFVISLGLIGVHASLIDGYSVETSFNECV